jgi:glycosyltransferase involved in cell wall biosynthesis
MDLMTDTPAIVAKYPQIKLLHEPERKGKTAAIDRAMQEVQTDIVVFTDANTLLNTMLYCISAGIMRIKKRRCCRRKTG